jgi:hypothetical protein
MSGLGSLDLGREQEEDRRVQTQSCQDFYPLDFFEMTLSTRPYSLASTAVI